MKPVKKPQNQNSLFFSFESTLNHKHPLFILANQISWSLFEPRYEGMRTALSGIITYP